MTKDIRGDGGPAPNEPIAHNPAYDEPDRIERVDDDRSGAGKTVAILAAGLLLVGALIVFAVFGGFGAGDADTTAIGEANRDVAQTQSVQSAPRVAPTDGNAVVVGSDRNVTGSDDGAAVVTPNAAAGKDAEIVTVPNQVKPKFAVEGDAAYVETEDGLKTVDPETGQVKPLDAE